MTYGPRKSDREQFDERHRPKTPGTSVCVSQRSHADRYCEGCGEYKPVNTMPHVKGWRCDDCKSKGKT